MRYSALGSVGKKRKIKIVLIQIIPTFPVFSVPNVTSLHFFDSVFFLHFSEYSAFHITKNLTIYICLIVTTSGTSRYWWYCYIGLRPLVVRDVNESRLLKVRG